MTCRVGVFLLLLSFPAASPLSLDAGPQARALEPGQSIVRDLTDGETHSYTIALAADDFVSIVVGPIISWGRGI